MKILKKHQHAVLEEEGVVKRVVEASSHLLATFPIQPRKNIMSIRYNCIYGSYMTDFHSLVLHAYHTSHGAVPFCRHGTGAAVQISLFSTIF